MLPPDEGHRLRREWYVPATYAPSDADANGDSGRAAVGGVSRLTLQIDHSAPRVPWSPLDLESDISRAELEPLVAEVRAGEMLLLPALWWHAVSQHGGGGGGGGGASGDGAGTPSLPGGRPSTIAVNYWYEGAAARDLE